jgi:nicotinamidase-related amidase
VTVTPAIFLLELLGGLAEHQGYCQDIEAYSGFEGYLTDFANPSDPPSKLPDVSAADCDLTGYMKSLGVKKVVVTGVATDFW